MRKAVYDAKIETLKDKYFARIQAVLGKVADAFRAEGFETDEIDDFTDEEFAWSFLAKRNGDNEKSVDVRFTIEESVVRDGEGQGVNFVLDLHGWGGRPLCGVQPFNYTSKVWVNVDDEGAVEERFQIVEEADPYELMTEAVERIGKE